MQCPACGERVLEGEDACTECGHSLTAEDVVDPSSGLGAEFDLMVPVTVLSLRYLSAKPDDTVRSALQTMVDNHRGSVVVLDEDGTLAGFFSEVDLLRRVRPEADPMALDRPLWQVMTHNPRTLGPTDTLAHALNRMAIGGFRHVPIIDDDRRIVGLVSFLEVLQYLHGRIGPPRPSDPRPRPPDRG